MFESITISRPRLFGLLEEAMELMLQYRDAHGLSEEEAIKAAGLELQESMADYAQMQKEGQIKSHHEIYHDQPAHNLTFRPLYSEDCMKEAREFAKMYMGNA